MSEKEGKRGEWRRKKEVLGVDIDEERKLMTWSFK